MSRVMTFSQKFPSYHPKAGDPTYFIEKLWAGMPSFDFMDREHELQAEKYREYLGQYWDGYEGMVKRVRGGFTTPFAPKRHTIRAGHRWKVGDCFRPRVWSGKPYCSPQITFAPDVYVKKVWDFQVCGNGILLGVPGETPACWKRAFVFTGLPTRDWPFETLYQISESDGLSLADFLEWFKYPAPFDGQIICWDENVNY